MNILKEKGYIILNRFIKRKKLSAEIKNSKQKKVFVLGTPEHGNLGDQAIAYAQQLFLQKYYENYLYVEIPMRDAIKYLDDINQTITDEDIVFIHGGGNMGSLYPIEEITRRTCVNTLKGKIISFPQSIYFEDNQMGSKELEKSKRSYNRNKNFVLTAREQVSFDIMKEEFPNEVLLTPDIVLSLNYEDLSKEVRNLDREGILVLFRNDKESKLNSSFRDNVIEDLKVSFLNVTVSDTNIGGGNIIPITQRVRYLDPLLSKFSKSELVVTDRLHGMIFSYITKTPCIVFENNNPKILSTYNTWLSDVGFIKLLSEKTSIDEIVEEARGLIKGKVEQKDLSKQFKDIIFK